MEIRFYNDPTTGLPHIYEHGITEKEVTDVLLGSGEDLPAKRGSRMKLGQTSAGRYNPLLDYIRAARRFGLRVNVNNQMEDRCNRTDEGFDRSIPSYREGGAHSGCSATG